MAKWDFEAQSSARRFRDMAPPPWGLLSPTGVPHDVPNLEALKDLASKTPGLVVARKNLLAMLVGVNDTEALIKR